MVRRLHPLPLPFHFQYFHFLGEVVDLLTQCRNLADELLVLCEVNGVRQYRLVLNYLNEFFPRFLFNA